MGLSRCARGEGLIASNARSGPIPLPLRSSIISVVGIGGAGFLGFWVWKGIRCGSLIGLAADELGVHAGVNASLGDEAFVSAAFDDATVVEHED